jgi:hypothetical protein
MLPRYGQVIRHHVILARAPDPDELPLPENKRLAL